MNLTVHNVYFCFSEVGCTISLRDGTRCKEVPAHTPTLFVAQQPDMVCSDPAAVVREIPNGLQLLHGQMMKEQAAGGVPAWFAPLKAELTALLDGSQFEVAWLAGENTLVVHTDRVSDELLAAAKATAEAAMPEGAALVQYNHNMEISWRDITVHVPPSEVNKYDNCINISEVAAVNADYKSDLVNGGWGYPLTALRSAQSSDGSGNSGLFRGASMTRFGIPILPNLVMARGMFYACGQLTEIKLRMPKVAHIGALWAEDIGYPLGFLGNCKKLNWAELYTPECIGAVGAFRGDTVLTRVNLVSSKKLTYATEICADCPALTSFAWEASDIHTATGGWRGCQLNKDSVLGIVAALAASPYKSQSGEQAGLITLGIHIDHQNDEEVLAAITNAEAKGWTLTVQWNGTPTAQASVTYGLRKPPIYARVSELERPDGTTERVLEWGHYVTDPSGYEEFRSVEAAREYYGLPEESLTNK